VDRIVLIAIGLVGFAVVTWLERRRRTRHAELAGEIAVLGGLRHESDSSSRLPVEFELLAHVRDVFNVLRDRQLPADRFGCNLQHRRGRDRFDAIVGVARLSAPVPDLQLRRQGVLGAGRRDEMTFGDDEFDDRWIVSTDDPEFWRSALDSTLRAWLTTLSSTVAGVELEICSGWALVTTPGTEIERIPEMLEHARTFAGHVAVAR
jgi:hypothetical protein